MHHSIWERWICSRWLWPTSLAVVGIIVLLVWFACHPDKSLTRVFPEPTQHQETLLIPPPTQCSLADSHMDQAHQPRFQQLASVPRP